MVRSGLERKLRKPIGWKLRDDNYNDLVRVKLGIPAVLGSKAIPSDAFHLFTDGSCIVKRRKPVSAGWGFVLFAFGGVPASGESSILEAFGPVIVEKAASNFIGATRLSNNTGELSAVVEALLWLLSSSDFFSQGTPVVIHTDSKYVLGILTGKFAARENIALSKLALHLWSQAGRLIELHICWVKAHSRSFGNEMADKAARSGSDPSKRTSWWDRPFALHEWGADVFVETLHEQNEYIPPPVHLQNVDTPTLQSFTTAVVECALASGSGRRRSKMKLPSDDADMLLLFSLQRQRRDAQDHVLRQTLSLQICRVRRRVRRRVYQLKCEEVASKRMLCKHLRKNVHKKVPHLMDAGAAVTDAEAMGNLVTDFYKSLFTDAVGDSLPGWVQRRWHESFLNDLPPLDSRIIKRAILHSKKGKTCSEDSLVMEMLLELDDDILDLLASSSKQRILNSNTFSSDPCWDEHLVTMLRKKGFQHRVNDFRPIAVLPVLYKVYSRVLLLLQGGRINELQAPQFAFRAHYQAHEVVFIIRNLVEKSLEWSDQLFILDGDLRKAYDYTRHAKLAAALEQKGAPSILTAAWLREFRRCASIFVLDQEVQSRKVLRTRSLPQGDPAAPELFNVTLDVPAAKFCELSIRQGWGFKLDCGTRVALVLFADNFWIFAESPCQLSAMTAAWLDLLEGDGWSVPLEETTWCTTGSDDIHHAVNVRNVELPRASRSVGFKVLGAVVTFDNVFEVELQHRISRAWRAFYSFVDVLCCRVAPWGARLELLTVLVSTSLFWCSGSWNLTARQCTKLRGIQQQMLQRMLGSRPCSEETKEEFMIRTNSKLKEIKQRHGVKGWDAVYHGSVFQWAGHVARIPQYDPSRLTHKVLHHRCWDEIQEIANRNGGNQMHGKRVRIWRWERPLYKYFGDASWERAAQDKIEWSSKLESMIFWRCKSR